MPNLDQYNKERKRQALPTASLLTFLGLALTAITFVFSKLISQNQAQDATTGAGAMILWYVLLAVLVGILVGGLCLIKRQREYAYIQKTHDWVLILKYQEYFESAKMLEDRSRAARILRDRKLDLGNVEQNKKEFEDIDPVLDFFEDLGFYMRGYQLTPEVAHHHFYHWIRGYWESAHAYINSWHNDMKEPARWKNLKHLYDATTELENLENSTGTFNRDDFLNEEIDMWEGPLADSTQLAAPPSSIRDRSIQTPSRESREE